ncbi:MAG: isoprenylcysteine carboxylmethyltransferase family protein [Bacteroidetes bacterium]|nr:isoprenylcysteine carboxylmethyltransferase family protein [Bacteroidota bacterium]MBU1483579.1 isoprenylcysteine carboxylmethyltransferase family protein [Bacteroidota bacterium]MBU2046239.1 isoprenylcysteine carboxylmethyltransferase family protein [Bacteroidota bacterium]MBU2267982.1 isoprenylcysteine carboxylmethyltransferase family protein [Bacteroidota bacterium]MBU2375014.1 isoprenylcysteine carboxylmethyltransferase family protein [Bacteroidota bacterium]
MKIKDIIYVAIQFTLFIGYAFVFPIGFFSFPLWLIDVGLIIGISGGIILALALLQLNKNLSPFPTPKTNSELVTNGLYKWMRHPIYSGIILFVFGFAIYSENEYRLFIAISLLILFYFKSSYEENLLKNKFPTYTQYQQRTRRFFPFI